MASIHIIGLGVAEQAQLTEQAVKALLSADTILGAARQWDTVRHYFQSRQPNFVELPKFTELRSVLDSHAGQTLAVLASGDPLYYGIGRWFSKQYDEACLSFYPAVSSIQVACHRLGLALQDIDVISLHGRPLHALKRSLRQRARLMILTDKESKPQALAQACVVAGFDQSMITVCEKLGYTDEKIRRFVVTDLIDSDEDVDPLHVSFIEVLGKGGQLPEFPGIEDAHFHTGQLDGKGMISKREVRLAILSYMQASQQDVIWDVGAGCGGVSVELALWQPLADVYAIELHSQRLRYLHQNREKFGVLNNLHIIQGRAPAVLASLPRPNKVFIGGSDGELTHLLETIWHDLPAGGLLVASGVIDSTKKQLRAFAERLSESTHEPQSHSIESVEIAVKRGDIQQQALTYTAKLPVEIFKFSKW